jgi:hypothetical protein
MREVTFQWKDVARMGSGAADADPIGPTQGRANPSVMMGRNQTSARKSLTTKVRIESVAPSRLRLGMRAQEIAAA